MQTFSPQGEWCSLTFAAGVTQTYIPVVFFLCCRCKIDLVCFCTVIHIIPPPTLCSRLVHIMGWDGHACYNGKTLCNCVLTCICGTLTVVWCYWKRSASCYCYCVVIVCSYNVVDAGPTTSTVSPLTHLAVTMDLLRSLPDTRPQKKQGILKEPK